MITIYLKDLMDCRTYPAAGSLLYDILVQEIDDGVMLNAKNVASIPSMFLNMSIGKFIEDYGYDRMKGKVSFSNMTKVQGDMIKKYISSVLERVSCCI